MKRQVIIILTIFLAACGQRPQSDNKVSKKNDSINDNIQDFQTYFVNDIVSNVEHLNLLQTQLISNPKVVFIEKEFTLNVNKTDLLNVLKIEARESDEDFEKIYNIVINYIKSTDSLTFEHIWTKGENFDDISWFETDRLGPRNLTKKILKETICRLIENGGFEIILNNKKERNYFFERVDSDYGGNVKGVFTADKKLIWICPPFIID
ncbi:hypothetical protein [Cyclobacterium sp. SYSU L10401]|uniref:hypothetical protein n=1 Tax=Cyclobacterium sp. SYSU L10401 TaxID=2678657 RepID=UPI0013D37101|nr:hypothetical protein [Cyclobacterium sp. SYSU L10401]